jgi:hypothetical protein
MERFRLEEIYGGGRKGFIRSEQDPGIFSEKTQKVFIIGHRKLRAVNEIIVIVEIVIQKRHAQWKGQGYGQEEQGMFSQSRHCAVFSVRRKIKAFSLMAVNKRFVFQRVLETRQKRKWGKAVYLCPKHTITA